MLVAAAYPFSLVARLHDYRRGPVELSLYVDVLTTPVILQNVLSRNNIDVCRSPSAMKVRMTPLMLTRPILFPTKSSTVVQGPEKLPMYEVTIRPHTHSCADLQLYLTRSTTGNSLRTIEFIDEDQARRRSHGRLKDAHRWSVDPLAARDAVYAPHRIKIESKHHCCPARRIRNHMGRCAASYLP